MSDLPFPVSPGGEKPGRAGSPTPQTGRRIDELQSVAEENGLGWRKPGHGGGHVIFSASGVREIVSVPAKRPIKPVYIRQFLALIDNAVEVKQDENKNKSKP